MSKAKLTRDERAATLARSLKRRRSAREQRAEVAVNDHRRLELARKKIHDAKRANVAPVLWDDERELLARVDDSAKRRVGAPEQLALFATWMVANMLWLRACGETYKKAIGAVCDTWQVSVPMVEKAARRHRNAARIFLKASGLPAAKAELAFLAACESPSTNVNGDAHSVVAAKKFRQLAIARKKIDDAKHANVEPLLWKYEVKLLRRANTYAAIRSNLSMCAQAYRALGVEKPAR